MKISKTILIQQLGYLYQLFQVSLKNRVTIKGWCITVWLAILVIASTQSAVFQTLKTRLIIFGPIVFFWFMEAIEGGRTTLYREQVVEIEDRLAKEEKEEFEIRRPSEYFVLSRYARFSLREKFHAFIRSAFTSELIVSFYAILIFASVLIIWLVLPSYFNTSSRILCSITTW